MNNIKQSDDPSQRAGQIAMLAVVALLIVLRFILSSRLPAFINADSPHDDSWMVSRAIYFLRGQWMGPYDQYTLIKGVFSPLLLAFSVGSGLTFSALNTALYCFACLVFVLALCPLLKRRWTQLLCFVLLLFNPITFALHTGQRVYRSGISQWQLLLIFGCLSALFLRRGNKVKSLLKWAMLGGAAVGAFFQTREDGVFLYPFLLVAIAATILACVLEKQFTWKRMVVFILPLALATLTNGVVSEINNAYYGGGVINDRDGGNYAKAMQDLYLIMPDAQEDALYQSEEYQGLYYNIYVSTVEKAFSVSPTLESAAQPIRNAIARWDGWEDVKDGQPYLDHILFAIRDGVAAAGHYQSLPETEAFYGKVHAELQMAFQDGLLQKRGISLSAMVAPLKAGDLSKTFALLPETLRTIVCFEGVSSEMVPAAGSDSGIEKFRLLSGGDYFTASSGVLKGSGWAFSYDGDIHLTAMLCDASGAVLCSVPFVSGLDVFDYFGSLELVYPNAENCRFSFALEGYDISSGLTLRFVDSTGAVYREIPLDGSALGGSDGEFQYNMDKLYVEEEMSLATQFYAHFVDRANAVTSVYQKLGIGLTVLAGLSYLWATATLLLELRKKRGLQTLPAWLCLTGLGLSLLLLLLINCFMTATTFFAGHYLYLSPSYALLLMFWGTALCWAANSILDLRRQRASNTGRSMTE